MDKYKATEENGVSVDNADLADEDFQVFVNSVKVEFSGTKELDPHIYGKTCYTFDIKENIYNIMVIELKVKKTCTLEYVEIEVYEDC